MKHLFVCALLPVLVACGSSSKTNYPAAPAKVETASLSVGDRIEVRVFYGSDEIKHQYTLDDSGTVALPYIGEVEAVGKTQGELKQQIRDLLADGYLKDPVVSIDLLKRLEKKVSLIGEVKAPQTLAFYDGMTIVEAVVAVGGFTPLARKNDVTVTRIEGGQKNTYTVPVEAIAKNRASMFVLQAGDVIFVPERRW